MQADRIEKRLGPATSSRFRENDATELFLFTEKLGQGWSLLDLPNQGRSDN